MTVGLGGGSRSLGANGGFWPVLSVVVALLASAAAGACGGAGSTVSARSATAPAATPWPKSKHLPSIAQTRRYIQDPNLPIGMVREDSRIFGFFGEAADATDSAAMTSVAKRYYVAAARGDSASACAMLAPNVAKAMPINYGRFGPRYLRGASSCRAVVSRMFSRDRAELTAPIVVTGVLVRGGRGYALLYSTKMPASMLLMELENGVWRPAAPIAGRIPVVK